MALCVTLNIMMSGNIIGYWRNARDVVGKIPGSFELVRDLFRQFS